MGSTFGLSAYCVEIDKVNGPSIATAWCLVFLTTLSKKAIESRRILPVFLTGSVLVSGFYYGKEMIDFVD